MKEPFKIRSAVEKTEQKQILNDLFSNYDFACKSEQEIDEKVSLFAEIVSLSKEMSSYQRRHFQKKPLPPYIVEAIKRRKELRKLKRTASPIQKPDIANAYNRANRHVRTLIKDFNTQDLETFAMRLSSENDTRKM